MSSNDGKEICEVSAAQQVPRDADAVSGALYIHVPFCQAKCRYCDFYSLNLDRPLAEAYLGAARTELDLNISSLRRPLATVFVGGGTPTVLGANLLRRLLAMAAPLIDSRTEFSVEANPGTVDEALAAAMAECGVNRVNLGVQSFNDDELALLGRIHDVSAARSAIAMFRSIGFENLGIDLIYGIPGQTLNSWRASLRAAMELQVAHLSCYALSFEEGTPLAADLEANRVEEVDESLQREMYFAAIAEAQAGGLEHYETSNFARPGRQCRHNLTYWRNEPYLGIGPAAASCISLVRRTNSPDVQSYIEHLSRRQAAPCQSEKLPLRLAMAETLMLGLRLIEGIDRNAFKMRFGQDALEAFPQSIKRFADDGALVISDSHIRFSQQALFASDTVLAEILAEA